MCCIPTRMDTRLAIVTGANSGIGKAVTAELARRGCEVIMACRDMNKAQQAKDDILDTYGPENPDTTTINVAFPELGEILTPIYDTQLRLEQIDMASFESIREFVERVTKLERPVDFLINNAATVSQTYEVSADGHELHFAVNYLGIVLLTELLLPLMKKSRGARIINVSSMFHFNGTLHKPSLHVADNEFGPYVAYCQSKLALTMYTVELAERLKGTPVVPISLHPGTVDTGICRDLKNWRDKALRFLLAPQKITAWESAQMFIHALLRRKITPGGYYDHYERIPPAREARNKSEREWLWNKTHEMIGISRDL
ncbi:unnamed protein product [Calicophoron daubneyi]|uniref:Uncharacterized protein n=1 Tax=Calicophoron daubneyi TaxID=300641 RepID=A0AAV2T204_CALDB